MQKTLILASSSPRRKELLHKITDNFVIVNPSCEEIDAGTPHFVAETNAVRKGRAVDGEFVLACDTLVSLDGVIYGKPKTERRAIDMIKVLNGKEHIVTSGVYVRCGTEETAFTVDSHVVFKKLTDEEIVSYVKKYRPLDKAGSYGIQDGIIVDRYEGSPDNIIGLPTERVREVLGKYTYVKEESNN